MYTLRPYLDADKADLLLLFDQNTPGYFHVNERADLAEFLDSEIEHYFVCEHAGRIIACGGANVGDGEGYLSWYIVHPDYHGRGAGSMLVAHNMGLLLADKRVGKLVVRTSQLVYPFYSRFGYELKFTEDNYWGDGFHLYHMERPV